MSTRERERERYRLEVTKRCQIIGIVFNLSFYLCQHMQIQKKVQVCHVSHCLVSRNNVLQEMDRYLGDVRCGFSQVVPATKAQVLVCKSGKFHVRSLRFRIQQSFVIHGGCIPTKCRESGNCKLRIARFGAHSKTWVTFQTMKFKRKSSQNLYLYILYIAYGF
jgi:hypothetical protein